jgi:hypothetical protein
MGKINWRRLQRRLLQPPYIPQLSGPLDASAFANEIAPEVLTSDGQVDRAEIEALFKDW